jgi:hypothetical protein
MVDLVVRPRNPDRAARRKSIALGDEFQALALEFVAKLR